MDGAFKARPAPAYEANATFPPPQVKNGRDEAYHQLLKIRSLRAMVRNKEYPVSKFVETMYTTYLDLDMIKLRRLLRKQVT